MAYKKGTVIYLGGMEMPNKNAAAHRVLNNAKILSILGYHIVFSGVDKNIKENIIQPVLVSGFESLPAKYPESNKEWIRFLRDFSHIELVLNRYADLEIVIAYNMHAFQLRRVEKYCKKNNVKLVADVTEWYENKFSLNPIKLTKWFDTHIVMTKYLKHVDGMISISKYLTSYYKAFVSNILELPPLVDIEEKCWHQTITYSSQVSFMYTGIPDKKDEVGLIVKAFSLLPQDLIFRFDIVGLDKKQFIANYPESIEALNFLGDKVRFYGRVSHDDSVKTLLCSDYCIFIRQQNRKNMAGFPTKFVECITTNIGIVANDISNIKDYFPQRNSFLLQDIKLETIKVAVEAAIKNGKIKNRRLVSTFDYRNYVSKFEEFLGVLNE